MLSRRVLPTWIVHVKTQAKNSHLKAYLARTERAADACGLVQERCKLAAVDGIEVAIAGRLDNQAVLSDREVRDLENGDIVRWQPFLTSNEI